MRIPTEAWLEQTNAKMSAEGIEHRRRAWTALGGRPRGHWRRMRAGGMRAGR
jgi:hypothetical protein